MPTPRPIARAAAVGRLQLQLCWRCSHRLQTTRRQASSSAAVALTLSSSAARLKPPTYFLSNPLLEPIVAFSTKGFFTNANESRRRRDQPLHPPPPSTTTTTSRGIDGSTRRQLTQAASASEGTTSTAATATDATAPDVPGSLAALPPHRRRRQQAQSSASASSSTGAASSSRSALLRQLPSLIALSKPRLTVLVVLTAVVPYALYPTPDLLLDLSSQTPTPSLSPQTLLFLTLGTALTSAAANALNMAYESRTDALMSRTRARPVVRGAVSRGGAVLFAAACALVGGAALYLGVNPTVAALGLGNVVLYAGVYTPLKAVTAANTWVGAVVGGVPPLMGWCAGAGEVEGATTTGGNGAGWRELLLNFSSWTTTTTTSPGGLTTTTTTTAAGAPDSTGGWLLFSLLVAWQFPHFCALSHPIAAEYRSAGLRMLAWTNPARNARVALRYSLLLAPVCVGLCAAGVVEWSFALTTLPANAWIAWQAGRFWWTMRRVKGPVGGGGAGEEGVVGGVQGKEPPRLYEAGKFGLARGLFWASVWYIPVVLVLAMAQKKGLWARVWRGVVGLPEEEEEDEWEEEEVEVS